MGNNEARPRLRVWDGPASEFAGERAKRREIIERNPVERIETPTLPPKVEATSVEPEDIQTPPEVTIVSLPQSEEPTLGKKIHDWQAQSAENRRSTGRRTRRRR